MRISNKNLWRVATLALVAALSLPSSVLAAPKQPAPPPAPVKVTVLATTGISGHIIDWDYKTSKTADLGLTKISTLVKKERQQNSYTLLVDSGNMFTGSALTDNYLSQPINLPNPVTTMYNYLGYDAVTLGEADLAYGTEYLSKALSTARFPVVAANINASGNDWSKIKPFTVKEFEVGKDKKKDKLRIGIIGSASLKAAEVNNHPGLKLKEEQAVDKLAKSLESKLDAVIVVKNSGIEINGATAALPGKLGSSLSRTELIFEKVGKKWQLKHNETVTLYTLTASPDKGMSDYAWPYHDTTLQHLKDVSNQESKK